MVLHLSGVANLALNNCLGHENCLVFVRLGWYKGLKSAVAPLLEGAQRRNSFIA